MFLFEGSEKTSESIYRKHTQEKKYYTYVLDS